MSFLAFEVGFDGGGPSGSRERFCISVRQRAVNSRRGDRSDLITVDEAQPFPHTNGDPVEQVQVRDLQDVVDLAELSPGRGQYRRTFGQSQIGNWLTLIHESFLRS